MFRLDDATEKGQKYQAQYYKTWSSETFHLANKLMQDHVNFENQIMKVYLAAQVFSLSLANGIDHCRENLKLPEFQGSAPTTKCLRVLMSFSTFWTVHQNLVLGPSLLYQRQIPDTGKICLGKELPTS